MLTADAAKSKFDAYLSGTSSAWCEQLRTSAAAYEAMASRSPTPCASAGDAVGTHFAGGRYVDPDMFARALDAMTEQLGCTLGDAGSLARAEQRRVASEAHAAAAAASQTKDAAIRAASCGDAVALGALLAEAPEMAVNTRVHLLPFSSVAGLRGLEDRHGYGEHTLLTLACEHNHAECVALLCARGADANFRLSYSKNLRDGTIKRMDSPLHLTLKLDGHSTAEEDGSGRQGASRLAIVRSLLDHRADLSAKASRYSGGRAGPCEGASALHMAALQPSHAAEIIGLLVAEALVRGGASGGLSALVAKDRAGATPLVSATTVEAVEALLEARAQVQPGGGDEVRTELKKALSASQSRMKLLERYDHLNPAGRPLARCAALVAMLDARLRQLGAEVEETTPARPPAAAVAPRRPDVGGQHLGIRNCTCTPGANEVCWGYRPDSLKSICPRCAQQISAQRHRSTEGCRMNGDAYGWITLTCESCGLVQKEGWDDA